MRQIVIDELSPLERDNIDSYLKRSLHQGPMVGLYWLEIPADLYSAEQQNHSGHGPFYFAVELEQSLLRFELLARSTISLHCSCIAYATPMQRQFILDFIDRMLLEEYIKA